MVIEQNIWLQVTFGKERNNHCSIVKTKQTRARRVIFQYELSKIIIICHNSHLTDAERKNNNQIYFTQMNFS